MVPSSEEKKNEVPKKEINPKSEYIPPDGGWGWVIVFGYIIAGLTAIPIIQNFGLVYKQRLKDLSITSTELTTIIAMNSSLGQMLGIFQGPLLKRFGCRPMALIGVSFLSLGSLLTGFSQTFTHFILTHGVITSIGFTYTLTSFSMSMNSYFKKKRTRAAGLFMGFTGIGPVVMPLFVTYSLGTYGVFGTGMLLAGLNLHGLIGACLLQPVKKHLTKSTDPEDVEENPNELPQQLPNIDSESVIGIEPMNGFNAARRKSSDANFKKRMQSVSECEVDSENEFYYTPMASQILLSTLDEEEDFHRPDLRLYKTEDELSLTKRSLTVPSTPLCASTETLDSIRLNFTNEDPKKLEEETKSEEEEKGCCGSVLRYIKEQFDLDLLQDPVYISITLGMSIAVIGELMFSLLTPFILNEIGLDLQQTAYFMSIVAVADIVSRFVSPYMGELVKLPSRAMYILALFFLLFSRAGLLFVSSTVSLIIMAIIIGIAKGVRSVFWGQVLPDYVPNHKLASAMSIQNLCNGILVFFAGPLSGKIVEINNSYLNIIYVSNALTAMTILLWSFEYVIIKCKSRNKTEKT